MVKCVNCSKWDKNGGGSWGKKPFGCCTLDGHVKHEEQYRECSSYKRKETFYYREEE